MMMDALKLQYEAEIEKAKANIQVYLSNPVGIGEHPDLVSAINSQIEVIANANASAWSHLKTNFDTDNKIIE